MTVPIATYPKRKTLSGAGETIQVPFYFPSQEVLAVTLLHANGSVSELSLNTDYTVTGEDQSDGGAVTLGATTGTSGDVCLVALDIPISQLIDFVYADGFRSNDIERALDRLTSIMRMFIAELENSMKISLEEEATTGDTEIPRAADRAGKVIYFDDTTGELDMLTPAEWKALVQTSNTPVVTPSGFIPPPTMPFGT